MLVIFVLIWGTRPPRPFWIRPRFIFPWPGLHNMIQRMPPITPKPALYAATYTLNLLSAAGTACFFASLAACIVLRVSVARFFKVFAATGRQLALPLLTIASVLALAYIMNYSGQTATLGLVMSATGVAFPFFSALLGWLGVFLPAAIPQPTGCWNLAVVTGTSLGLNPTLMASANSAGGVVGKMISLQSIAVAAAATGMARSEESKLLRFTLRHSVFLFA